MKILQLRFQNLNSLYGEWSIDFTSPVYQNEGIFAIIGPTGAGKSTILDAICLGLYGRTPRLVKVNKTSNEIMSRHCGECFSEVTFSTAKGTFRAFWSQHKARKSPTGNLVDYKHELAEADSGKLLETKRSITVKIIEEKTGMDFDRFTRSILLAQGSFDTFLKADSDKRSPILEQITGTSIYSEISIKVHERKREEQEKLNSLETELGSINLLSDEQENTINTQRQQSETLAEDILKRQKQNSEKLNWLTKIENLKNELSLLTKEAEEVANETKKFEADKALLNLAQKAARVENQFVSLSNIRKQHEEIQERLNHSQTRLPALTQKAEKLNKSVAKAELELQHHKEYQKETIPLLHKVRSLDQQIADKTKHLGLEHQKLQDVEKELTQTTKQLGDITQRQQKHSEKTNALTEYVKNNSQDEILITELTGIVQQLQRISLITEEGQTIRHNLTASEKTLQQEEKSLKKTNEKTVKEQKTLEGIETELANRETSLKKLLDGRLKREYLTELDNLQNEIMYLRKISSLEEERQKLIAGTACPLCGSENHPFSKGELPVSDTKEKRQKELKELIEIIESLEKEIEQISRQRDQQKITIVSLQGQQAEGKTKLEATLKGCQNLQQEIDAKKVKFEAIQKELSIILSPLGLTFTAREIEKLTTTLQTRQKTWIETQRQIADLGKEENDLAAQNQTLTALQKKTVEQQQVSQKIAEKIANELKTITNERKELLGEQLPELVEKQLQEHTAKLEKILTTCKNDYIAVDKQLGELNTLIASQKDDLLKASAKVQTEQNMFIAECVNAGFEDEKTFLTARLTPEKIAELLKVENSLKEKQTSVAARQKDRSKNLEIEEKKSLTDETKTQLTQSHTLLEKQQQEVAQQLGSLKQQLADNNKAKEKISSKQLELKQQKSELIKWQKLHALIGSNDGKKYRNFAQGLTFELMVQHANRQLEKMNDRYLLVRDQQNPLELNVIDNYQAGEERSTKNLSGGESFIISLALALGLSNMASRHIRVDSLFLDEGFGTLDEEALEIALTALSSLQQDDKLIGVISHVQQLQERITNQIEIVQGPGGKSQIKGIGCEQIY